MTENNKQSNKQYVHSQRVCMFDILCVSRLLRDRNWGGGGMLRDSTEKLKSNDFLKCMQSQSV